VTPAVEAVWPIVLTAVVITVCLAVHAGLVRVWLGVLFDPLRPIDRMTQARIAD